MHTYIHTYIHTTSAHVHRSLLQLRCICVRVALAGRLQGLQHRMHEFTHVVVLALHSFSTAGCKFEVMDETVIARIEFQKGFLLLTLPEPLQDTGFKLFLLQCHDCHNVLAGEQCSANFRALCPLVV